MTYEAQKTSAILIITALFFGWLFWDDYQSWSKEQIGATVKSSIQNNFNSDPRFKGSIVTDVQVTHKGGNQYQGIAKVTRKGTPHNVLVEITADGETTMWQIAPGELGQLLF